MRFLWTILKRQKPSLWKLNKIFKGSNIGFLFKPFSLSRRNDEHFLAESYYYEIFLDISYKELFSCIFKRNVVNLLLKSYKVSVFQSSHKDRMIIKKLLLNCANKSYKKQKKLWIMIYKNISNQFPLLINFVINAMRQFILYLKFYTLRMHY